MTVRKKHTMALLNQWNNDDGSTAAIWKIEEPESFFIQATGLVFPGIRNEKRRMERLAGRFLLKFLQEDFPLHHILPDAHDKPRIAGNKYFFSISHSWPYVAAVVSPDTEAGIDIQRWHPRMHTLQQKFLSPEEQLLAGNDDKIITLAWCAKEAAYKWQGNRKVDFIAQLPIIRISPSATGTFDIEINIKSTKRNTPASLKGIVYEHFAMAIVNKASAYPGHVI